MSKAKEAAIRAAIKRGQTDVLASKVTPHPAVARLVRAAPAADADAPAGRAVVRSDAARDVLVAKIHGLVDHDAAATLADAIDRAARVLGRAARGVEGVVPHTYETNVPGTALVLAFELVTWTKAGEVVAILHLFEAARDAGREHLLWS